MDDFERKYNDLMDKLDEECELAREFFCVAFYSSEHVIVLLLIQVQQATDAVADLAWHYIYLGVPL